MSIFDGSGGIISINSLSANAMVMPVGGGIPNKVKGKQFDVAGNNRGTFGQSPFGNQVTVKTYTVRAGFNTFSFNYASV